MQREEMLIEAGELLTKINDPNLRIYDATILFFREEADLTAHEQYQQGHIPGAAFFDHDDFSDPTSKYMYMALPPAYLARQIGHIGIANESEVIFYTFDLLPTGSSLLPCTDLMQDMAAFLPDDVLAARLQAEAQHKRIITYCGGGIVATTNAMAHLLAGNKNVAVYDSSMDEWSKEGLPITTG